MGQDGALLIELNAEQTAREFFDDGTGDFNAVFFTHCPLFMGISLLSWYQKRRGCQRRMHQCRRIHQSIAGNSTNLPAHALGVARPEVPVRLTSGPCTVKLNVPGPTFTSACLADILMAPGVSKTTLSN